MDIGAFNSFFFLRRPPPPRSTPLYSSAASDVYKRQRIHSRYWNAFGAIGLIWMPLNIAGSETKMMLPLIVPISDERVTLNSAIHLYATPFSGMLAVVLFVKLMFSLKLFPSVLSSYEFRRSPSCFASGCRSALRILSSAPSGALFSLLQSHF